MPIETSQFEHMSFKLGKFTKKTKACVVEAAESYSIPCVFNEIT